MIITKSNSMFISKVKLLSMISFVVYTMCSMTGIAAAQQHHMKQESSPLTMPGNEIFGTIQEVIHKLEADPNTDWSKVNLEALRQHLLDMKAFTEEVDVVGKKPIANGVEIHVRPQTKRAEGALERLFSIHPKMLKQEKGWNMTAKQNGNQLWTITCTTKKPSEVKKIRALGYIGLLAEGSHHQLHHWMIATGRMSIN